MKEGWTYKKLGEVCDTINGLWKGKKPPFVNVGVIRNANFTKDFTLRYDNIEFLDVEEKQYSKRKLLKGDLIVEKSGGSEKQPVGRAVLFNKEDGEFSFSNFTSVLRIKDKNAFLSEFLFIYLLYVYRRGDTLNMQKATTGIHNIEFEKYLNIRIPYIPLSEQRAIVARLDSVFAQIDSLKANAEKQLSEARQLFQKALEEAMTPKEGWEEKTLGEISKITHGKNQKDVLDENGQYPIYGSGGNVMGYANDFLCEAGTTILGRKGSINNPQYINERFWNVDTAFGISAKEGNDNKFVYYFITSVDWLEKNTGTTLPSLTQQVVGNVKLFVPPLSTQHTIVAHLDALSSHVRALEAKLKKMKDECDALKQAMLREVFE